MRSVQKLGKAIRNTPSPSRGLTRGAQPAAIFYGFVVSVDATEPPTLTITLAGSSVPISLIALSDVYQATAGAGDTVQIQKNGPDLLVLCAVAS